MSCVSFMFDGENEVEWTHSQCSWVASKRQCKTSSVPKLPIAQWTTRVTPIHGETKLHVQSHNRLQFVLMTWVCFMFDGENEVEWTHSRCSWVASGGQRRTTGPSVYSVCNAQSVTTRLVRWCYEPSQPWRFIEGLVTHVSPYPTYSAQKSSKRIKHKPQSHNFLRWSMKHVSSCLMGKMKLKDLKILRLKIEFLPVARQSIQSCIKYYSNPLQAQKAKILNSSRFSTLISASAAPRTRVTVRRSVRQNQKRHWRLRTRSSSSCLIRREREGLFSAVQSTGQAETASAAGIDSNTGVMLNKPQRFRWACESSSVFDFSSFLQKGVGVGGGGTTTSVYTCTLCSWLAHGQKSGLTLGYMQLKSPCSAAESPPLYSTNFTLLVLLFDRRLFLFIGRRWQPTLSVIITTPEQVLSGRKVCPYY